MYAARYAPPGAENSKLLELISFYVNKCPRMGTMSSLAIDCAAFFISTLSKPVKSLSALLVNLMVYVIRPEKSLHAQDFIK